MAYAIWVTGLPGSGKSSTAKELVKKLKEVEFLRLDVFRKEIVPEPKYTEEERELVYTKLAERAIELVNQGKNVIVDATAYKKKWRDLAREKIKNFVEVYIKCPLDVCIERESKRKQGLVTAEIYKKALDRKLTGKQYKELGDVIGVDVPYEENEKAELIIDAVKPIPEERAEIVIKKMKELGYI
ncbi:adenylyl-sulfate kinase [Candidatus Woesearchaeota archaeon]|nr:adenylyl-sulfate kinase [Candidatus Woesearchaeota archaeon]